MTPDWPAQRSESEVPSPREVVREKLRELGDLVPGLESHPADRYRSAIGPYWEPLPPPTKYERAFELTQSLCRTLYPGVDTIFDNWKGREPDKITAVEPEFDSYTLMPLPNSAQMDTVSRLLLKTTLYSDVAVVVIDSYLVDRDSSKSA